MEIETETEILENNSPMEYEFSSSTSGESNNHENENNFVIEKKQP